MNNKGEADAWYWESIININSADQDLFSWHCFENGATGIEEVDSPDNQLLFKVYFPATVKNPEALIDRMKASPGLEMIHGEESTQKEIVNWQDNWKEHFKPLKIGQNFVIRPSWEAPLTDGRKEIVIYPGQGFGTGYHESTKIALELLEELASQNNIDSVLDVGAGSGILTIGALLLGAAHVTAVDIDECVLEEIPRNIEFSGVSMSACSVYHQNVAEIQEIADLVMANIEDHILSGIMKKLIEMTNSGGYLLLSGILIENKDPLLDQLPLDFSIINERFEAEWYACVLKRS